MWFEKLMGFNEVNPDQVCSLITVSGESLVSKINGSAWSFGCFEIPSLKELRLRCTNQFAGNGRIQVSEQIAGVISLHQDTANNGAVFQVASQFNLLEMVSPSVIPEDGVGRYEYDRTQGPACAIACGAATIFRNYFVDVNGQTGQTRHHQIDCLDEIGQALGNVNNRLWEMRNGYALATSHGLKTINACLKEYSAEQYDALKQKLRVGIHWNTEVTVGEKGNSVTQVFCSALPVAYSDVDPTLWERFSRLVLEAAYEATFCAAMINLAETGNNKLFLTLLGGGAFGNRIEWILDAIDHAIVRFSEFPLDVRIVSYGSSNQHVARWIESFKRKSGNYNDTH